MNSILGTAETEPGHAEIIIDGAKYRATHRASVIGIMGTKAPPVYSRGDEFYHTDRWTSRYIVDDMCKWAKANPGCVPTRAVVAAWISKVNAEPIPRREIVIANTPDRLPYRTAMALTGGAYHEALHGLLSAKRDLVLDEMCSIILPRWALVKDWSRHAETLLMWSNIVEDIRIERRGCEEFEAIHSKMCDLQDFILAMEAEGDEQGKVRIGKDGKPRKVNEMSIIIRVFRDAGTAYNTDKQQSRINEYKRINNEAVELVIRGPLAPCLEEAINLKRSDDCGALRVAMDVIAKLAELGKEDEAEDAAKKGQAGDGTVKCPKCGAPGDKIVVRPKADGKGGKVPGKGIATCTVCGWQQEVDIVKKPQGAGGGQGSQPGPKGPQPKFEGFDDDDLAGQPGTKGHPAKDGKPGSKPGDKADGAGGKPADKGAAGAGGDKDGKDGAGAGKGDKDGDKGEGDADGDGSGEGDKNGDDGDGSGTTHTDDSITSPSPIKDGKGAGGHYHDTSDVKHDWSNLASAALANRDTQVLDVSTALGTSVKEEQAKANRDIKKGEMAWNPFDPSLDDAPLVKPSQDGKAADIVAADLIVASVKEETAYLRSRMRTILRAMEQTRFFHGVPKGHKLSGKFLVHSKAELRGGHKPSRAYQIREDQPNMKMSAAVCIDQSGSMAGERETATRIMVAICEPLDSLQCPTLALGIRDGRGSGSPSATDRTIYHRRQGVTYDIFKLWGEKFRAVRWRFSNTRAVGGTPLADGVEYGLRALSQRPEEHRFLFVVTDGEPNSPHELVIQRQVRLAEAQGIYVIGVGIGSGCKGVMKLFKDHVWTDKVSEFPKLLLKKMNDLVDYRSGRSSTFKET